MSRAIKHRRNPAGPRGMTLIEVIIGLVLVSGMVIVFGVSLVAAVFAEQAKQRNLAGALADQEFAALQTLGGSQIPVQTNGPLLGVLFAQGTWAVAADAGAPSAPNVLEGVSTSSATSITAIYPLPDNAYADGTFSAHMKVASGAPAGWKVGLVFRSRDLRNGYQLYLSAGNLKLDKVVNGVVTNLYSDIRSIAADSWQTLSVNATGSSLAITLNGTPVTTVIDTSYSVGQAALAAWGGATARFDDIAMGSAGWNFDADATGAVPDAWLRFGLTSLPNGTATLTTASLYGDSGFKQADLTFTWIDRQGTKSLTRSAFISN